MKGHGSMIMTKTVAEVWSKRGVGELQLYKRSDTENSTLSTSCQISQFFYTCQSVRLSLRQDGRGKGIPSSAHSADPELP